MNNKILFTLIVTAFTTTALAEELYGPAVSVNGVDIPRAKVMAQTNHLINARGMGSGGITQPGTYRQIQDEVIEQLVVQELLWQEAKRKNFVVPEEDVDAAMAQAKSGFDVPSLTVRRVEIHLNVRRELNILGQPQSPEHFHAVFNRACFIGRVLPPDADVDPVVVVAEELRQHDSG